MSRLRQRLILTAIFPLLLANPAWAQEGSVFVDRVDVNLVNVEVFVTDSSGRHVEGLTRDDFEIFENGKPVEVANFYTVARQTEGADAPQASRTTAPVEGMPEVEASPALPPEQQLHLLVYVDNFNIRQANRKRVLESLESFLGRRAAEKDRIMLVTYNRGIEVFDDASIDQGRVIAKVR